MSAQHEHLVEVGRVGRPHGLDGAFVVERPSDDPERFAPGRTLLVDGEPATVERVRRVGGGRLAIKLDRPAARGAQLAVRRSELPRAEEGSYYVFQLVGLEAVADDGRPLGRVRDVLPGAANDNLELENGELVPMVEDAILRIDLDGRRVVLNSRFMEL